MRAIAAIFTRRSFTQFWQKAWFLLALFPKPAGAQDCCPNEYVSCDSRECEDWGVFVLGSVAGVNMTGRDVACVWCTEDCAPCLQVRISVETYCCDTIYFDQFDECCMNDSCCWPIE